MSQANADLIRRYFDAWDEHGLDGFAEFWHPDINWRAIEGAPDDVGEMNGPERIRAYLQDWLDMFDDFEVEVHEIRALPHGRVLAAQRVAGRAKLSGVETELNLAVVYTIRDGKIVRAREYLTADEALAAVGERGPG